MFVVVKQYFYGITMNGIGEKAHVIKHSPEICVVDAFDKILH